MELLEAAGHEVIEWKNFGIIFLFLVILYKSNDFTILAVLLFLLSQHLPTPSPKKNHKNLDFTFPTKLISG